LAKYLAPFPVASAVDFSFVILNLIQDLSRNFLSAIIGGFYFTIFIPMKPSIIESIQSWTFNPNIDYSAYPLDERTQAIQKIWDLVRSKQLSSGIGMEYRYALESYISDLIPPDISTILNEKRWQKLTILDLCAWNGDPTKSLADTLRSQWYTSRIIAVERSRTLVEQMKKRLGIDEISTLAPDSSNANRELEVICANSLELLESMSGKVDIIMMNYALDRLPQRSLLDLIMSRSESALFVNCVPLQYSSPNGAITYVAESDRLIPEWANTLDALRKYFQKSIQSFGANGVTTLQDGREEFQWASIAWNF
jgi:hypothetical protein